LNRLLGHGLRCLPYVHLDTDAPWWVTKASFFQHFDQNDFLNRRVQNVIDAYLEDWFHYESADTRFFKIPPVSVINGRTQFISGRHRTAVLLRHLDRIPLSFDMRFVSEVDLRWMRQIALAPISTQTLIELPDLPIWPSLPREPPARYT
jgi:hypothetical protein